jgi:hypothetical protein
MAGEVENNIHSIPESANSAGNYHKGNGNTDDSTTSMCSNVKSQPSVSISGSAIVNVTTEVFANISLINELTLPVFHDSSKVSRTEEKIRGEFNDRTLKPYLEDENSKMRAEKKVTVIQLGSLMVCKLT